MVTETERTRSGISRPRRYRISAPWRPRDEAAAVQARRRRPLPHRRRPAWRRVEQGRPDANARSGTNIWRSAASPPRRSISATRPTATRPPAPTSTTRSAGSRRMPGTCASIPTRVGITGQSSGGHLAMLCAMRPKDPRYAAIPLGGGVVDRRLGALRRHDLAGHQPAVALPQRAARARVGEPAGLDRRYSRAPRHLLEDRGEHGRGQSDAGAGKGREARDAARDLGPGQARSGARLPRSRSPPSR